MNWTKDNCVPSEEQMKAACCAWNVATGMPMVSQRDSETRTILLAVSPHLQMRGECEPPTEEDIQRSVEFFDGVRGGKTRIETYGMALKDFCQRRADERDALHKEIERLKKSYDKQYDLTAQAQDKWNVSLDRNSALRKDNEELKNAVKALAKRVKLFSSMSRTCIFLRRGF